MGRTPKYTDPDVLEAKCNEYFKVCDDKIDKHGVSEPYTVPGLAYHIGFENRHTIFKLQLKKKFSTTIKRALDKIEAQRVAKALRGVHNPVFSIFDLKNNFGYKDKTEAEISGPGGGPIAISAYPPEPEALADWEAQMIVARKARQLPEKT